MDTTVITHAESALQTATWLLMFINAILHLLFAGAVARDAGALDRCSIRTALVSGHTWAFATLVGGVTVAAIYWFIHHSTFTRPAGSGLRVNRNGSPPD